MGPGAAFGATSGLVGFAEGMLGCHASALRSKGLAQ